MWKHVEQAWVKQGISMWCPQGIHEVRKRKIVTLPPLTVRRFQIRVGKDTQVHAMNHCGSGARRKVGEDVKCPDGETRKPDGSKMLSCRRVH
jgi:hypothetical protein